MDAITHFLDGFRREVYALSQDDRDDVINDWWDAHYEDGCTLYEYARRIGAGNVAAYAAGLRKTSRS